MNYEEIKEKFALIKNSQEYLRVNDSHPLELYLGKNEEGFVTLRFNGNFSFVTIVGTNLIKIKQIELKKHKSILFIFTSNENLSLFYHFCADVINETENYKGTNAYKEIVSRYNQWKKMFSNNNKILSENEILGLIGELMFLKNEVFKMYGITQGLNSWSGPEPTHKDFSFKSEWFEIKAVNSSKNSVSISSLEQLDSSNDGHLVIYYFEKMSSSFNGISLNGLVMDVLKLMAHTFDKDLFVTKLKQAGYSFNEVYDNYVYNFVKVEKYLVNDDFPRIKASHLSKGISKVKYDILISLIHKYLES